MAAFYAAIFLIIGCYMAYLPIWLQWRGLSETQITLIFAAPLLVRVVFTPLVSFAADRSGDSAGLVFWLSQGALLSLLPLIGAHSVPVIMALLFLFAIFWTSIIPLTETVAVAAARRSRLDYGQMRLWGSFTFIVATACGGVFVDLWGPDAGLWLVIGACLLTALAAYGLPRARGGRPPGPLRMKDARPLLRSPDFLVFLAATTLVTASHAVYNTLATIHWLSLGYSATLIGALWATGVIAEIALFGYSARVMARVGPAALIVIGCAAALLRWAVTALDPPLVILFPIQALHSLTYGAAHLGAIHFLSAAVPQRLAATGQGLYAAIAAGLGMGAAYVAAGPLYHALGVKAYFAMAAMAAASLAFALLLAGRWGGGLVVAEEPRPQPHSAEGGGTIKAAE